MNKSITELAKMLKDRENKDDYSPVIGRIIELPTVKIAVGEKIILTSDHLKMCVTLIHNDDETDMGKEVVLLPYADNQKYILIGVIR